VHEIKEQQRRDEEYDRQHGVSTSGDVPLTSLGVGFDDAKRGNGIYRPVWGELFHDAMAKLNIDHHPFVFLDYGSGKGKALLLASDYPFQRIIGVEYAEPLHRAAVENIQRYRSPRKRCDDLVSVCADATTFEPPDRPLVCFFFNPFDDETTARVLDRLRESVQRSPRRCLVLYANIRDTEEKRHVFRNAAGLETLIESRRVLIYELRPSASKGAPGCSRPGSPWPPARPSLSTSRAPCASLSRSLRPSPTGSRLRACDSEGMPVLWTWGVSQARCCVSRPYWANPAWRRSG
jgi:hypothetical protein